MRGMEVGQPAADLQLRSGQGATLRLSRLWQDRPVVLFFLRHLGCPCTSEQLTRIRKDSSRFHRAGAQLVFIIPGPKEAVETISTFLQPPPVVLLDPEHRAYEAYGLHRGGFWELAGPAVWLTACRGLVRGLVGRPAGDVRQLAGAFLIDQNGRIQYAHRARHSADFPDHEAMLARLAEGNPSPSSASA